jgi:hypothetical protein
MYAVVVRGAPPRRRGRGRAGTSRITRRQMREASPGFFAQLDWAVRVPILAGVGAALILRGSPSSVRSFQPVAVTSDGSHANPSGSVKEPASLSMSNHASIRRDPVTFWPRCTLSGHA